MALSEDDFKGSRLEALVRSHRAFTIAFALFAGFVIAIVLFDIFVSGSHPEHWMAVLLQLAYAFSASVLATLLLSRIVVSRQIANQRTRAHDLLGVLGVVRELEAGRVAIVVSSFPVGAVEVAAADVAARKFVERRLGFTPSATLQKRMEEMGTYAYARRDILLVTDLVRLTSAAGLPPPLIISDIDFADALNESASNGMSPIEVRTERGDPKSKQPVSAAILIGLWSNVVTCMLSDHADVPFTLVEKDGRRRIALHSPSTNRRDLHPSDEPGPSERPAFALLARLYLKDLTFVVLGGTDALGTARIGDFISGAPRTPAAEDLWRIPEADDLWSVLQCPGDSRRGDIHDVCGHHNMRGFMRERISSKADLGRRSAPQPTVDLTVADDLADRTSPGNGHA